jgi:glycine cleavage system protein P-like pyridoxal-binding family
MSTLLVFERSRSGRARTSQAPAAGARDDIPAHLLRMRPRRCPRSSELDAVRHYTSLSQKNFSIDTQFYPLGSCTMKYNPRAAMRWRCCRVSCRGIRWRRTRPGRDCSPACTNCRKC